MEPTSEVVNDCQTVPIDTGSAMEKYAQEIRSVTIWTAGQSRGDILQRMKYQAKTKQFMFVFTEIPVDPTTASMLQRAVGPKRNNPLCTRHASIMNWQRHCNQFAQLPKHQLQKSQINIA